MIITPHILAGAAIGSKVHNYWAVAGISLAVHFAIDFIPHTEYETEILDKKVYGRKMFIDLSKIAIDFLFGLGLVYFLLGRVGYRNLNYVLTGIFFSILPDILAYLNIICDFKLLKYFRKFHKLFEYFEDKIILPKWVLIGTQVVVSILFVWLLMK